MFFDVKKLNNLETEILSNERHTFAYSCISLWEISLKYSINKFDYENFTPELIKTLCYRSGIEYLNLDENIVASSYQLRQMPNHKDPFDRLLVWQCIKNDLTLISRDKKLEQYKEFGLKIID